MTTEEGAECEQELLGDRLKPVNPIRAVHVQTATDSRLIMSSFGHFTTRSIKDGVNLMRNTLRREAASP